ncbi:helix-turn-helix domain-containing protein [Corynebacterium amycolatum]|uniref:helix-turn-helix domain-containing protein n=1 Tax=Corynebacterium amycolatum TaxID=43765 RepID=UPI00191EAE13|nr:helix-turn-helix domain-containing protein [Corynebacterium amycolatum]QQU97767.1 helix-turn-helix domain-containing protein [Corynebacterium amycolatum]
MSLEASTWVRKHAPTKNPTEQVILMMLADRANDDGTGAWPYYARLAEEARCSLPTIKRVMHELEHRGLIRRGDQSKVDGYPNDRKPIVWDLNMSIDRQNSTGYQFNTTSKSNERGIRFDRTRYQIQQDEVSDSTERGIAGDTRNPHNHPLTTQEHIHAQTEFERVHSEPSPDTAKKSNYPAEFEQWWREYPRKVGKARAVKDWKRAMKRTDNHTLVTATRRLAAFHKTEGTQTRFIPHPSTWLNRDGWNDELTPATNQSENSIENWLTPRQQTNQDAAWLDADSTEWFNTDSGNVIDATEWGTKEIGK